MKLKITFSTLCLGLLIHSSLNAQHNYNESSAFLKLNSQWAISDKLLFDFNNPTSFVGQSNMTYSTGVHQEGAATVSDTSTGELLFYSNGGTVWDRNHNVMPNGSNLLGNSNQDFYTTSQGVCIVPSLSNDNQYYLFSLSSTDGSNTIPSKLYYSVVDMSLNNNDGDIVVNQKNILLDSSFLSEAMIAVPGNNCNIWLVTHTSKDPVFKVYEINANGIQAMPVLSNVGNEISGTIDVAFFGTKYVGRAYSMSNMKISPQRNKLVITSINEAVYGRFSDVCTIGVSTGRTIGTLLFDFDASTGRLSNSKLIDTLYGAYPEFSPNGDRLYLSTYSDAVNPPAIYQFDLSSGIAPVIMQSRTLIHAFPTPSLKYLDFDPTYIGTLRLYNDTIYCNLHGDTGVSRINSPNQLGLVCNFEHNAIPIDNDFKSQVVLPNEVVISSYDTMYTQLDTMICKGGVYGMKLYPSFIGNGYQYTWSDGSSASELEITSVGTYWVRYTTGCSFFIDTFKIRGGTDLPEPIINVDTNVLSTVYKNYDGWQWIYEGELITGATEREYTVSKNGKYQVIVNIKECIDTSAIYEVTNQTEIKNLELYKDLIKVFPNPTSEHVIIQAPMAVNIRLSTISGQVVKKEQNARLLPIEELSDGLYFLHISDREGNLLKVEKIIKNRN